MSKGMDYLNLCGPARGTIKKDLQIKAGKKYISKLISEKVIGYMQKIYEYNIWKIKRILELT